MIDVNALQLVGVIIIIVVIAALNQIIKDIDEE